MVLNEKCPKKLPQGMPLADGFAKNIQFTQSNGSIPAVRSYAKSAKPLPLLKGAFPIENFLA
jgi:hypothetical protein